jgi:hypothetical protein
MAHLVSRSNSLNRRSKMKSYQYFSVDHDDNGITLITELSADNIVQADERFKETQGYWPNKRNDTVTYENDTVTYELVEVPQDRE